MSQSMQTGKKKKVHVAIPETKWFLINGRMKPLPYEKFFICVLNYMCNDSQKHCMLIPFFLKISIAERTIQERKETSCIRN